MKKLIGMVAVACCTAWLARSGQHRDMPAADRQLQLTSLAQAPARNWYLQFEANQGQTDARVRFVSRGQGYTLYLAASEAVLKLSPPDRAAAVLRMKLGGAAAARAVVGEERQRATSNYFIGSDPARWRTRIPHYGKVRYRDVYPGVDVVFYGQQGRLEYDFVLAAGADPDRIRLAFDGASSISVDDGGALVLDTAAGSVRLERPRVYQKAALGERGVFAEYVRKGADEVGIGLGAYDRRRPLVIDPVVVYSTYLGGGGEDSAGALDTREPGNALTVDAAGSAYVAGETDSLDFPSTAGAYRTQNQGQRDAFIAKLDPTGGTLVYATYIGGTRDDRANAIAIDAAGNAYIAGRTDSMDLPTVNPLISSFRGGDYDAWMAELSADGSMLLYSTYFGGSDNDAAFGIALDGSNAVYLTGGTKSDDFPATGGAYSEQRFGSTDAWVAKIDPSQTGDAQLKYSTYLGGVGIDRGNGIAIDASGKAYLTGRTGSSDFPAVNGFQTGLGGGGADAFLSVLSSDGTALLYSTFMGGGGFDLGNAIAIDATNRAYVAGETTSTNYPTFNGYQTTLQGGTDAFVTVVDPAQVGGASLLYSTYFGGTGFDRGLGIAVDSSNRAYLTGEAGSGTGFPVTADAFQPLFGGGALDAFVAKLDPSQAAGASLVYSSFMGGTGSEAGTAAAVDNAGNVWVAGQTSSSDFPASSGALQPTKGGGFLDAFVAKIADSGFFAPTADTP